MAKMRSLCARRCLRSNVKMPSAKGNSKVQCEAMVRLKFYEPEFIMDMKQPMKLFTLMLPIVFLLAACSDPPSDKTAPTKAGAIQAQGVDADRFVGPLNAHLEAFPQCFAVHDRLPKIPGEIQVPPPMKGDEYSAPSLSLFAEQNPGLAELEKQGFISFTNTEREEKSVFGDGKMIMRYFVRVELTDKGQPFYRAITFNSSEGLRAAFCYGKKMLDSIDAVRDEAETDGKKLASVTYTYHVQDIAPWARTPEFAAAYPNVAEEIKSLDSVKTAQALFIADEKNEWVSANLYQKQ